MAYIERQLRATSAHPEIFRPGEVSHFCVMHDDFCPVLIFRASLIFSTQNRHTRTSLDTRNSESRTLSTSSRWRY